VEEYENVPSSVIFEAIRREGEHELSQPFSAFWWSGVAAGLAISRSMLCKGFLSRISHGDSCIGWANQRKLFCNKQLI
jgi:formate/nitrite transporter FocA (FNT family)